MLADATVLGERCEVKNINSLRNIRRAIQYEAQRQIKVLEEGGTISSETRSFDAQTGTTFTLRSKESAEDYRYFPDPDLPPVLISDADLARIQAAMPAMPDVVAQELVQALKLSPYDAGLIASDRALWTYFQTLLQHKVAPKTAANWLLNAVQAFLNEKQVFIEDYPIPAERLAAVIILVETSQISKVSAETILIPALIAQPSALVLDLATQLELLQTNNKDEIAAFIEQIFTAYPDKVKEYQKGKKGLLGFFVGETVRLAKGKIDAKTANGLWLERLKINP
jgi:aspartyl-tRNA(Asn)/glutamyl-tRNA(Gln) amidotransferase subunit B